MRKRLIINADDFGWDRAADEGILQLCELNCITSTTIIATHVTNESLNSLKQFSNISKGLHLNLIDGIPLASGLKTIVNNEGKFLSAQRLLAKLLLGLVDIGELEIEIKEQINKLRQAGIIISHVDSHRHIHLYPALGNIILPILWKNGIEKIRIINQNRIDDKRRLIIKFFSMFPNGYKKKFNKPDLLLCDFSLEKNIEDALFVSILNKAFSKYSTVELMTHPAILDRVGSYLNRKKEFEYLKSASWKEMVHKQNVELISYNDL